MCHRTLQSKMLARELDVPGVSSAGVQVLEAEVVVAVTILGGAAGFDDVDLRGNAVGGAEPGFADDAEPGIGVVIDERGRVFEGVFAEGVPDAVVFAADGEVVAFCGCGCAFAGDDAREGFVGCVQGVGVLGWVVHSFQDEDARPCAEDVVPFVLEGGDEVGVVEVESSGIVDGDVLVYRCCEWVGGFNGGLGADFLEIFQIWSFRME